MTELGDELLDLRDQVMALLWRHYGYFGKLEHAHPATIDHYRATADDVLDLIEAAGFVQVERGALAELLGLAAEQYDMVDACETSNRLYRLQRDLKAGNHGVVTAGDLRPGGRSGGESR